MHVLLKHVSEHGYPLCSFLGDPLSGLSCLPTTATGNVIQICSAWREQAQPPLLASPMVLGCWSFQLARTLPHPEYFPKTPLSATFNVAWGNMIFSFFNSCTTFFFFLLHISIKCCLLNISLVLIWAEGFCYHWPLGDQFSCTEPVLVFNSFFSKSCIYTSVEPFLCWRLPHFQLNECLKTICLSSHTDMPLPSKCWGDMKVLLRSGGDFDVNDVPQGTQPHSS